VRPGCQAVENHRLSPLASAHTHARRHRLSRGLCPTRGGTRLGRRNPNTGTMCRFSGAVLNDDPNRADSGSAKRRIDNDLGGRLVLQWLDGRRPHALLWRSGQRLTQPIRHGRQINGTQPTTRRDRPNRLMLIGMMQLLLAEPRTFHDLAGPRDRSVRCVPQVRAGPCVDPVAVQRGPTVSAARVDGRPRTGHPRSSGGVRGGGDTRQGSVAVTPAGCAGFPSGTG